MSQTTIKRIHLAYGIVLSLLVITLGILLIASCLDIYHSGPRPFSVESVSEHFAGIALPFYLCLIWALGGFVLALALPIEKSRLKATASPQDTLRRLSAKLDAAHQTELANMAFDRALEGAITAAKGRNPKAIKALLDVDTLKASKNQEADIKTALEGLQKESGYLFDDGQTPPPYASGTGTGAYQAPAGSDATLRAAMGLPAKNN